MAGGLSDTGSREYQINVTESRVFVDATGDCHVKLLDGGRGAVGH
jgi:hypothetical protein